MTIRRSIDAAALNAELSKFETCASDAPQGTCEDAKALNAFFSDLFEFARTELAKLDLKIPNDDRYREVEAVFYGAIKSANPDSTMFPIAEGFGAAMDGPARERVLAQAVRDRDFIRSMQQ